MCGICGFSWDDKALVNGMVDILAHRGPNQKGIYTDSNASLGHDRLSIIDLSIKGRQPMFNEDNSIALVFNGEIYNFKEIKSGLAARGHRFSSETDSEVVIHAYEEYGQKCVDLFNGMFAFALWDSAKKLFFLARDRAGIKPLYYSVKGNKLIFGSELKALLLSSHISREISPDSLYKFLTFRYTPGEDTIFRDIKKLPAGHCLVYKLQQGKNEASISEYWDFSISPKKHETEKLAGELNDTLKESIKSMLISDVPLGAFLSGGLDSTYVVSLMAELCDSPVKTFAVGFEEGEGYDETKFSRLAAEAFGTEHHEIIVKENSFELMPKILWHMDEPMTDIAAIPTYILSQFAKKKVSVVLTGEGADEIFGGYRKYKYVGAFNQYCRIMPWQLRCLISKAMTGVSGTQFTKRIAEFHGGRSVPEYYLQLISFFTKSEKDKLCSPALLQQVHGRPDLDTVSPYFKKGIPLIDSMMKMDFKTWLVDDILLKVDKTTLAHALEARVPFLDSRMLDLACSIPHQLKLRLNKEKYILRQAMKGKVPDTIYHRKKHGFNVPVDKWLEIGLKGISQEILSEASIRRRDLFNHGYIEKIFRDYKKSKVYNSRQLWTLLNFEIWARIYLDRENIKNSNIQFKDIA